MPAVYGIHLYTGMHYQYTFTIFAATMLELQLRYGASATPLLIILLPLMLMLTTRRH